MATATYADRAPAPVKPRRRSPRLMPRAAWWGTSAALAALFVYPIYVMLQQSLKDPREAAATPPAHYPHSPSLDNYTGLSNTGDSNVLGHIGNSVLVSVGATIATVILSTLAGYADRKSTRLNSSHANISYA